MEWSDAAQVVGKVAPGVGAMLGGGPGAAAGRLVARALGVDEKPEAVAEAVKADPDAAIKLRKIETDLEQSVINAVTERQGMVNETMRTEAEADDAYVRRWRPTFGYLVAVSWAVQSIAIGWTVIAAPAEAGTVAQAITALTPMWSVALAVLGINVHKRSQDKQVAAGQKPGGFMDAIKARVASK